MTGKLSDRPLPDVPCPHCHEPHRGAHALEAHVTTSHGRLYDRETVAVMVAAAVRATLEETGHAKTD